MPGGTVSKKDSYTSGFLPVKYPAKWDCIKDNHETSHKSGNNPYLISVLPGGTVSKKESNTPYLFSILPQTTNVALDV